MNAQSKNPTSLTKHGVIIAAIKLADAGGLEQLSMRKLGRQLNVEAMALYYHFANKRQLIEGMVDYVHGEIKLSPDETDWQTFMKKRAESAFEVLMRHPWASSIMDSSVNPGPSTLNHSEAMLRCLRKAGFSIEMSVHAVTSLNIYVYGAAQQYAKLPFSTTQQAAEVGKVVKQQFPANTYPYLAEMITQHMLKTGYNALNEFRFGLDLILDSITRYGKKHTASDSNRSVKNYS